MKQELHDIIIIGGGPAGLTSRPFYAKAGGDGGGFIGTLPAPAARCCLPKG